MLDFLFTNQYTFGRLSSWRSAISDVQYTAAEEFTPYNDADRVRTWLAST